MDIRLGLVDMALVLNLFCNMSSEVSAKMTNTNEAGKRIWKPTLGRGGAFAVFAERPFSPLITAYCVDDTYFPDEMLEYGMARLSQVDCDVVKKLCGDQLRWTSRPTYRRCGRDKAVNWFFVYVVDYDEYKNRGFYSGGVFAKRWRSEIGLRSCVPEAI